MSSRCLRGQSGGAPRRRDRRRRATMWPLRAWRSSWFGNSGDKFGEPGRDNRGQRLARRESRRGPGRGVDQVSATTDRAGSISKRSASRSGSAATEPQAGAFEPRSRAAPGPAPAGCGPCRPGSAAGRRPLRGSDPRDSTTRSPRDNSPATAPVPRRSRTAGLDPTRDPAAGDRLGRSLDPARPGNAASRSRRERAGPREH